MKNMRRDVPLKEYSAYRIGGPARYFLETDDSVALQEALVAARAERIPFFIMGSATNLLISDSGFAGLVIRPLFRSLSVEGTLLRAGAGVLMADALDRAIERGLAGLEWAGGLPGTVGGAVRGNAGAFGGETKDAIREVVSLDISGVELRHITRTRGECAFGYRNSIFKINDGKELITEAVFELAQGDREAIRDAAQEKIRYRAARHPMELPNIGSTFKNVPLDRVPEAARAEVAHAVKTDPFPVVPAAYLISETKLQGTQAGGAMISPKHPNFIVNAGGAHARDVEELIARMKDAVHEKFGIVLEEEVMRLQ